MQSGRFYIGERRNWPMERCTNFSAENRIPLFSGTAVRARRRRGCATAIKIDARFCFSFLGIAESDAQQKRVAARSRLECLNRPKRVPVASFEDFECKSDGGGGISWNKRANAGTILLFFRNFAIQTSR